MKKIYTTPEMELEKFTVSNGTVFTSTIDVDEEDPDTGFEF